MNFDKIHLEYEKAPTIGFIAPLVIVIVLFITCISFIIPILYHDKMILFTSIAIICIIILLVTLIIAISLLIKERKDGDFYGFYIGNDDDRIKYIKRITEEEYNFIQNVKDDHILGEKIKEEDINRVRSIIKKERM